MTISWKFAILSLLASSCNSGSDDSGSEQPEQGDQSPFVAHAVAPDGQVGDFYLGRVSPVAEEDSNCNITAEMSDTWSGEDVDGNGPDGRDGVDVDLLDPDCELICSNASECVFEWGYSSPGFAIVFMAKNHIFVPKMFTPTFLMSNQDWSKTVEVRWDEPGDWGLAPSWARYQVNGRDDWMDVNSEITDGKVWLNFHSWKAMVDRNTFACGADIPGCDNFGDPELNGVISDDLMSIDFKIVTAGRDPEDYALRRGVCVNINDQGFGGARCQLINLDGSPK